MNTGQFDSGECYICYAKRKKAEHATMVEVVKSRDRQIDDLVVRAKILQSDTKKYKQAMLDTQAEHQQLSDEWKAHSEVLCQQRGDMQLVAGRYQYQFEHAMKCINNIDDFFEYRYKSHSEESVRAVIQAALATFTEAVKPKGK